MLDYIHVLGEVVKASRKELGLSQSEVADRADIDVRTVLNIENYRGNPKMEVLFPLIRELKIDPRDIFYPEMSNQKSAISQFQLLLSQYHEDEIQMLLPICEAALSVLHARHITKISDEE